VKIRATFEDERGYGPAYGLNGLAYNTHHVMFGSFSLFFSLFHLLLLE
jgi:hypothetical protein